MIEHIPLLVGAGLLAGAMNAIAGGGSFVTFPAMVFAGLPPVIANATSTVALLPGTLASSWAYRKGLRGIGVLPLRVMMPITLVGGLVGGLLLLWTPGRLFDAVVPWLLLLATLVFAGGRELVQAVSGKLDIGAVPAMLVQFLIAVYGGYFGGAVGLMMLAAWSLFEAADFKSMAPTRTVMVSLANAMAAICFVLAGAVRWPEMLAMMGAAVVGSYAGARLAVYVPARVIRILVLILSVSVTAHFFLRQ